MYHSVIGKPSLRVVLLRAATAVFMLVGVWAASLFVRHGLAALAFPYPLNYGEGPLLDRATRLADLKISTRPISRNLPTSSPTTRPSSYCSKHPSCGSSAPSSYTGGPSPSPPPSRSPA